MNLDDGYELTNDPYIDPQSGVLRNLLGITHPPLNSKF